MRKVKRPYESPRRQAQAAGTRRRMIRAARRLFTRRGVATTSMDAIARQARVSPQLLYLTFGSKRALAVAVIQEQESEAGLQDLLGVVASEASPMRQIRALARFNRVLFSGAADLFRAAESGADADDDFAAATRQANERRRLGMRRLVEGWRRRGVLAHGVRAREAADVSWMLTSPETYRLLVQGCAWTPARYERWLVSALAAFIVPVRTTPRSSAASASAP